MNRVLFRGGSSILALVIFCSFATPAWSQDDAKLEVGRWYPSLEAGLNLSQSAYSDNWAGGDAGQITWTFILSGELKNQLSEQWNWHNTLRLAYGQTSKQDNESRDWDEPSKSTDRIDLESILRATLGYYLDPFASMRVESQFQDASDGLGRSLALNPITVKESLGFAHEFYGEEKRQLLMRFGGALRQSFRRQFANSNNIDDTETISEASLDGGLEFVVDYKNTFFDDAIAWTSKATVYRALFYSGKSTFDDLAAADLLGNIDTTVNDQVVSVFVDPDIANFTTSTDFDWENVFTGQITKYLSMNLYVRFVYDKYDTSVKPLFDNDAFENAYAVSQGIRKAGQFKQTIAVGLTYRFF